MNGAPRQAYEYQHLWRDITAPALSAQEGSARVARLLARDQAFRKEELNSNNTTEQP